MTYFKLFKNWFIEGKFLFLAILFLCFTSCLDNIRINVQLVDIIRLYGLFLQLLGALVIFKILTDKLQLFIGHGIIKLFMNYFKSFPISTKPKKVFLNATLTGSSSLSGELRGVIKPSEDLKDVIRYFDEEIQYLHKRIATLKHENRLELQEVKDSIANFKNSLDLKLDETKQLIIKTSISNPWLELFGVVCIFWGLILGTIPDIMKNVIF